MKVTSVAERMLFTTVRLQTEAAGGTCGVGTAFIYSIAEGERRALFLVTNKHVVEGADLGHLLFTPRQDNDTPALGASYTLRVRGFEAMWHGHPDSEVDVTVAPFLPIVEHVRSQGTDPFFRHIPESLSPNEEDQENLDALEECVFLGYPNDVWDSTNNLPVSRRGITASHPAIDFRGTPTFLLDASVFPGSSGSPVLVYNSGAFASEKGGAVSFGTRVIFLGLVASVFFREESGRLEHRPIPTGQSSVPVTREMLDLGLVFKARTIREAIDAAYPDLFGDDDESHTVEELDEDDDDLPPAAS